jgi:hypothetical protein
MITVAVNAVPQKPARRAGHGSWGARPPSRNTGRRDGDGTIVAQKRVTRAMRGHNGATDRLSTAMPPATKVPPSAMVRRSSGPALEELDRCRAE